MMSTFSDTRARPLRWRRELTPVIAVAALAADYLSPPALWTILLPFAGVVLLLSLRKPVVAAIVFVLSSWVLIPSAARLTLAVEDMRGEHQLLAVEGAPMLSLHEAALCLPGEVPLAYLPVGPDHLLNPRWALRESIVTFA